MHDLMFRHQDELEFEDLIGYAGDLQLDVERFARDLGEARHAERVHKHAASAEASGARGTPTFFIGNDRHLGPHDTETLAGALEAARVPATATD
jgi:predicted DsbA family dithiol-disulfide isomerase